MNWRQHTEIPQTDEVFTAVLAARDETGSYLMSAIFHWKDGRWTDENDETHAPATTPFWWLPEAELLADLPEA